jgi:2-iminobutanoate/2-iminopropanoate deaminase
MLLPNPSLAKKGKLIVHTDKTRERPPRRLKAKLTSPPRLRVNPPLASLSEFVLLAKSNKMKKVVYTESAPAAIGPYSQAIEKNGMLFISGQVPIDPGNGKVVEGDIKVQTEQVMKNIGAILEEAGYSFSDVIKSTCLLSDMSLFAGMNEVYGSYYAENPPARAAFAVKELPLGVDVEIETIAVK